VGGIIIGSRRFSLSCTTPAARPHHFDEGGQHLGPRPSQDPCPLSWGRGLHPPSLQSPTPPPSLQEEMKDLFEYIRTVRAFGRDKDIMDGGQGRSWGVGTVSGIFFGTHVFLIYFKFMFNALNPSYKGPSFFGPSEVVFYSGSGQTKGGWASIWAVFWGPRVDFYLGLEQTGRVDHYKGD